MGPHTLECGAGLKEQIGSFPITFTRTVEPLEGGCQVSVIVEGDASVFFRLAEPLLAGMVRRSIKEDYASLKAMQMGS